MSPTTPTNVDFDQLSLESLQLRRSEKWNTYPDDVLPAWIAEMDFPLAPSIREGLIAAVERGDLGYPIAPNATGLPEAFSERMQERFGWSPDPARTEILTDVVQGLFIGLEAYAQQRKSVVVQTPIYPPFLRAVHETGRQLIDNRLREGRDGELEFDLEALRSQLDEEAAVLLLCNPHNPSGRVYTRAQLETLAELVIEYDMMVVSDEIHADLVFGEHRHIPLASLGGEIAERTMTLTSATKAFNIAGLRCAVAHFGTPELHMRFRNAVSRHVRGGVGLLGIYATLAAWQDSQPWLDAVLGKLDENRHFLAREIPRRLPELRYHEPDATFMAWLDCRKAGIEGSPAQHFLRHGRVALSDGRIFGEGYEGFARLNFATSPSILGDVLDRIRKALDTR